MRDKILSVLKELEFATFDEIKMALGDESRKKTIEDNLENMEREGEIMRLFSSENTLNAEGFIPGPNLEVEEDPEVKKLLIEQGRSVKHGIVKWEALLARLASELRDNIQKLIADIDKLYKDPKTLELEYFDYSIRYHELYRLFNEKTDVGSLKSLSEMLKNCRSSLDKLVYTGTP